MPIVYIIMPCYNGEVYLLEQLMSIYYQNYQKWYLIFVNDGSTDHSENIVKDWVSNYNLHNKVKIINKNNGGVNTAVQRGLEEVKNICDINNTDSLISYCDADDVRTREKLQLQVNFLNKNSHIGLVYHDLSQIDENGILIKKSILKEIYIKNTFFFFGTMGNRLTSTEILFRAKYIDLILPMPIGFGMNQDKRTTLVMSLNNVKFGFIDKTLANYRSGQNSQMKLSEKAGRKANSEVRRRYMLELKNRFPDKDISYFVNYNYDRYVKRYHYGIYGMKTYILVLLKYPLVFWLGVKTVLYKIYNKCF